MFIRCVRALRTFCLYVYVCVVCVFHVSEYYELVRSRGIKASKALVVFWRPSGKWLRTSAPARAATL